MKGNESVIEILESKDIKPTPNRVLVARKLMEAQGPMSLTSLEESLDYTMDKASIFRVLELFSHKDVVHTIEDGSRSLKYELCHGAHHHTVGDQHVHFHCEQCGRTFCFEDVRVPEVAVPEGFAIHSVNYMIKGVCPECSRL